MITNSQVETFLSELNVKINFNRLIFLVRDKNLQTLAELNIVPKSREKIILDIKPTDYVKGPENDSDYYGKVVWVFGKTVKSREIYIKVSLGEINTDVVCISFHIAEEELVYPLK